MTALRGVPARTLQISGPAIPQFLGRPALEAVRLSGHEGINGRFAYELLLKSPDSLNIASSDAADFDLNAFLGKEVCCSIQLDGMGEFIPGVVGASADRIGAGVREINAIVTEACFWGEEGRDIQYKLTLQPWLYLAELNTDCRIYQDKTVVDILDELLGDYPYPVDKRLSRTYPPRDYQTQFNESDLAFFERLCQRWGISYFFEHSQGRHRLVLIDELGAFRETASAAYRQVDYHAPGWKTDAEYVHSFVPHHRLTSGRATVRDYDYTRSRADLSASLADPRPTGHADGEVYQWHDGLAGSHYAQPLAGNAPANDPQAEAREFALLRMQGLRADGARAQASGNLRGMVPGCTFALRKHPRRQANAEYLVLETRLLIEDVGQSSQIKDAAVHRRQRWKIEVDFTAHPMSEPLRPALTRPTPWSRGPQAALVVGPPGENLWTDHLGRIKVQFPWDRKGQKNQNSSCWIRAPGEGAGNQQGSMHIPRIGQELIIDFYGGNPDLPVCMGSVHNGNNLPPWELPGQAALSGLRSRELTKEGGNSAAGRSNHLILDDTDQKIQVQLKSDHQSSSLSMGHIARIEDRAGRKDERGEGFELRTDAHGAIRAKEGLLITTEARANAQSHIKDIDETMRRLTEARALLEQITAVAQHHEAQDSNADQSDVVKGIKAQNQSIEGEGKAQGEFTEPHLLLASPAGIASSTPQSTHIASGQHTQLTTGEHLSIAAGRGWFASVVDKFALFVQKAGMTLVAAAGRISIQAQSGDIQIVADQGLSLSSQSDYVEIRGKLGVRLYGGSSMVEISDLTKFLTPSPVLFYGSLETLAPKSVSWSLNAMPTSRFDQQVRFLDSTGNPAPHVAYDLLRPDGNIPDGKSAASGTTPLQKSSGLTRYTVRYKGELP